MRHWPPKYDSLREAAKAWLSELLIKPRLYVPSFLGKSARRFVEHFRHAEKRERISKVEFPVGLELSLFSVSFVDLVFTEDFTSVERGVSNLLDLYGGWMSQGEKIHEWFRDERDRHFGGSINWGIHLGFEHGSQLNLAGLHSMSIVLHRLSASAMRISYRVFPTEEFKNKYLSILRSRVRGKPQIIKLKWSRKGLSYSFREPDEFHEKQKQINDMLLKLNRAVVALVRKHIRRGWAMRGPLPRLEIHLLKGRGYRCSTPKEREFWMLLGLDKFDFPAFQRGSIRCFDRGCDSSTRYYSVYRLLVRQEGLLKGVDLSLYGTPENAVSVRMHDDLDDYEALICLREHREHLLSKVNELEMALAESTARTVRKGAKTAFKATVELCRLEMQEARLCAEGNVDKRPFWMIGSNLLKCREIRPYHSRRKEPRDTLEEHFLWKIGQLSQQANDRLRIARVAYDNIMNVRGQEATNKANGTMVMLTGVLLIVTVVLIPKSVWDWLWNNLVVNLFHLG